MDAITEHHYHNIAHGKAKKLEDGDLATVRTTIVEIDGVETLIPTIWDGKEVDIETAVKFAKQSGVDWPTRTGPDAVAELQEFDEQIHSEMTDQTTPQEAARILREAYRGLVETVVPSLIDTVSGATAIGRNLDTYFGTEDMTAFPKINPSSKAMSEGDEGFALGGLAVARKGITTPEGLEMAEKTTQLDRKKADRNKDGKLSKYEETVGKAIQDAMADDPEQDEKVRMGHGGMATMGDYDCGMMSDPMPIGSTESEVADDISAMISENEYVLPANVVKWHGLKHIMAMQDEAEMGLMMMHEQGLIQEVGGEEDEYEHHMMYDPKTGEGRMTTSYQDHLDLKNQGWGHESETEEESDSTGVEDAEVSDAGDSEQEEKETIETPEGNEIEMAGVKTVIQEPEMDETEDYKLNNYGKSSQMFGVMKKPKFSFIM